MNEPDLVSNSSPLIALAQIHALSLLRRLFPVTVVPPAVHAELRSVPVPAWIQVQRPSRLVQRRPGMGLIGAGEREAISLAIELRSQYILLDDHRARTLAEHHGLSMIGTLGLLVLAKRRGLVPALQPQIAALRHAGFYVGDQLEARLLHAVDEA